MTARSVAAFDIDGTVFRSSLFLELTERLIEKNIFPSASRELYEKEYVRWLNRHGDYGTYLSKVIEVFLKQIKGVPYQTVADTAGEILEEKKNQVYRYTRDLIKKLKEQDYFILGVSRSPKFIVDGFGYEHGFDKTYGMLYTTGPSGNFTGEVEHDDLMHNKAAILHRAMRKEELTLKGSFGVGDTETDIPFLEEVETAIAFNPNAKLFQHAKRRGWKVVVERKDVVYEF